MRPTMRLASSRLALLTMLTGICGTLVMVVKRALHQVEDDLACFGDDSVVCFRFRQPDGHFLLGSSSDAFSFATPLGYLSAARPPWCNSYIPWAAAAFFSPGGARAHP